MLCFELILAIWYQRFYNSNLGKLNFILVSHYSLAESEICWPLRFILNGKYSASIMTSIKENAFEIWRANLHYFRATLIIVVNKVLCCARRGTLGSKKNWQIPKYRVKSRRNADTAFMIGHVAIVSISRVCLPRACMHQKWTSDITRKRKLDRCNDREAR